MNSQGTGKVSARAMTEEIERATNAVSSETNGATVGDAKNLGQVVLSLDNVQAGIDGDRVIGVGVTSGTDAGMERSQRDGGNEGVGDVREGIFSSPNHGVLDTERIANLGSIGIGAARRGEGDPTAELERDLQEEQKPEEFVGVETNRQVEERLQEDLEDAQNEAGAGLSFENRVAAANQEEVARAFVPEVDAILKKGNFVVDELVRAQREGSRAMLRTFGRALGDRN